MSALEWKLRIEGDSLHHRGARAPGEEGKGKRAHRDRPVRGSWLVGGEREGTCQEKWGLSAMAGKAWRDRGRSDGRRWQAPEASRGTRARCETGRSASRHGRVRRGEKETHHAEGGGERERSGLTSGDPPASLAWRQSKSSLNRVGRAAAKCTQGRPRPDERSAGSRGASRLPHALRGSRPIPATLPKTPRRRPRLRFKEGLRARRCAPGWSNVLLVRRWTGGFAVRSRLNRSRGIVTLRP